MPAEIKYQSVDISDATAMKELKQKIGPHAGIFNLAGVLSDAWLADLNWDKFAAPLKPKVYGTQHLHDFAAEDAKTFVLFSSMASLFPFPGQINHSAANAFEDASAHERTLAGRPSLSINWGLWMDVGSAKRALELGRRQGIRAMGNQEALASLRQVLGMCGSLGLIQVAICPIDWVKYTKHNKTTDLPIDRRLRGLPVLQGFPLDPKFDEIPMGSILQTPKPTESQAARQAIPTAQQPQQQQQQSLSVQHMLQWAEGSISAESDATPSQQLAREPLARNVATGSTTPQELLSGGHPVLMPETDRANDLLYAGNRVQVSTPLQEHGASEEDVSAALLKLIQRTLASGDTQFRVEADVSFAELGMDSLFAADFARAVAREMGVEVEAAVLQSSTIHSLTQLILSAGSGRQASSQPRQLT
ncbi:orfB [Symbiodinium pilosum]|uniref:OrfB protein n=1 Tax=Symbiodinium pilosum TaxID=2952 RepID=A0A812VQE5_SYMPI|nr:orfB [Symbiodinium pilosum]